MSGSVRSASGTSRAGALRDNDPAASAEGLESAPLWQWSWRAIVGALCCGALAACAGPGPRLDGAAERVPATDARIEFTDGLAAQRDRATGIVHFDRQLDTPGRGFRWDSPGTRMRWRTDAARVHALVRYTDRHTGAALNSVGVYRVDGRGESSWTFTRPVTAAAEASPLVRVEFPPARDGAMHDYELMLPYADSVELVGVEATAGARWAAPTPRPRVRYLAFGDSVTQGFTASRVTTTYAFQVAERRGWQLLNLGIGGRGTNPDDAAAIRAIEADVISLALGVNDWQGGADLADFRARYERLLAGIVAAQPRADIHVVTPLWVPPTWQPAAVKHPLEAYRAIIRELAATHAASGRVHVIDGPALIDADAALFDAVAVHPNDAGFAQMAERLATALREP